MPLPFELRMKNIQKILKVPQTAVFDFPTSLALEKIQSIIVLNTETLDFHKKEIQKALGFTGKAIDGFVGPGTLSRIEQLLDKNLPALPAGTSMIVSRKGINIIVEAEVTSQSTYNRKYKFATWPGGSSGITIGIGYDLGFYSPAKIAADWDGIISGDDMNVLQSVAGLTGDRAKQNLSNQVKSVEVLWEGALQVFYNKSLPEYAKQTKAVYPGVELLPPDAQAVLVSLVYNRGTSLLGNRRTEMKNIVSLVATKNLKGIAAQIRSMKRLWNNTQRGLLIRREDEARLVENATYFLLPDEYFFV